MIEPAKRGFTDYERRLLKRHGHDPDKVESFEYRIDPNGFASVYVRTRVGRIIDVESPRMDNPKAARATRDEKSPLDLLEHAADLEVARALQTGAVKYGKKNYRTIPIFASTYGAALRRHVGAWLSGEDLDPESGLSHLAHVGANLHVLYGAIESGTFVDDRGPGQAGRAAVAVRRPTHVSPAHQP
jgi:hypothetical protein